MVDGCAEKKTVPSMMSPVSCGRVWRKVPESDAGPERVQLVHLHFCVSFRSPPSSHSACCDGLSNGSMVAAASASSDLVCRPVVISSDESYSHLPSSFTVSYVLYSSCVVGTFMSTFLPAVGSRGESGPQSVHLCFGFSLWSGFKFSVSVRVSFSFSSRREV